MAEWTRTTSRGSRWWWDRAIDPYAGGAAPHATFEAHLERLADPRRTSMDNLTQYLEQNRDRFVEDLKTALRIPSISAQPEHKGDMLRCAEHFAAELRKLGMTRVEVVKTAGHPIVYGEWLGAPGKPTALLYGHYDGQPPDPLELWKSPPFEPVVRDGKLYA